MTQKTLFNISLLSYILASHLWAESKILNSDCGSGYDTFEGILKISPFKQPKCNTKALINEKTATLIKVNNLNELFKKIEVKKTKKFFENYLVQKIYDTPYINRYTITVLYYEKQNLYETYLKNKNIDLNISNIEIYGDSYIDKVKSGGKHIVLFHILTDSKKSYKTILKQLSRKIHSYKAFQTYLQSISQTNKIIIKEYFSKGLHATPSSEIPQIFQQSAYFSTLVKTNAIPYQYHVQKLKIEDNKKRTEKQEYFLNNLSRLLEMQYQLNNYHYFRHHIKQFKPIDNNKTLALQSLSQLYSKTIHRTRKDSNYLLKKNLSSINNIDQLLPQRYNAYAENKKVKISTNSLSMTIKNFTEKITSDKNLTIELQSKIDIQNKGKLARIENIIKFHYKQIQKEYKETKILCDTYVNYPGLKFKNIAASYGSLKLALPFTKYTQYQQAKGEGIIKSAICGYNLGIDNTFHISCKNIQYKTIEINFEHNE